MCEIAAYAMREEISRGRKFPENEHPYRSLYQRDRDRIIHCGAFRRLEYKTQVFANYEGDFYRTRLTHTLEVMQIARTMARALSVNEDLVEALALAHDVGHSPFGHTGERALNELLADAGAGKFNHNSHGLRVVDFLEQQYADFPGLNLTYETREGFARHNKNAIAELSEFAEFRDAGGALIEQQIVEVADGIAYNNHDLDDGLYSEIIHEETLEKVALWKNAALEIRANLPAKIRRQEMIRHLIDVLTNDAIETTQQNLRAQNIASVEAVRQCQKPLVTLSPAIAEQANEMKKFLQENFYASPSVQAMMSKARKFIIALFAAYRENPRLIPLAYREEVGEKLARRIADYLAGMTDRFLEKEYQKLFLPM